MRDLYICGDQPTTCPTCGRRTEYEQDRDVQHHSCMCGKHFDVVVDDEPSPDEFMRLEYIDEAILKLRDAVLALSDAGQLQIASSVSRTLVGAERARLEIQARIERIISKRDKA